MTDSVNDPKRYRAASQPHESAEAANKALAYFYEAVAALRSQYQIADLVMVTAVNVSYGEDEGRALSLSRLGNGHEHTPMAAYALGQLRANDREEIATAIAGENRKAKGQTDAT